jgi:hypothetical protein
MDLAHELVSAVGTCQERKRRMPATPEGAAYAEKMGALVTGLIEACTEPGQPGLLVADPDRLDTAEAALEAARRELYPDGSAAEFLALDVLTNTPPEREVAPQVVVAEPAVRTPAAVPASAVG